MNLALLVAVSLAAAPTPLTEARKLADQLRYEESVVEYQRYLAVPERPVAERAAAMQELGFIHLVLGDEANAESRTLEALELDPRLQAPASAPPRQQDFMGRMRKRAAARAHLDVVPRHPDDAPALVRVAVKDPEKRVQRVLVRHAGAAQGPYTATELSCADNGCQGLIPAPRDSASFTAWYYVEALDVGQATLARAGTPEAPLQLAVVDQRPWYTNPWVWGVAGAALVGAAGVTFALSPAPPK